jgi:protocatechuate 3,4-dioxygenase beta subunit
MSTSRLVLLATLFLPACGDEQAATVSQTVGSAGGTVATTDGASIDIPPGALAGDTTITITPTQTMDSDAVGQTYIFGPEGLQFSMPVTVTLPFDPTLLSSDDIVTVYTAPVGTTDFIDLGGTVIDLNHVQTTTTHFSLLKPVRPPLGSKGSSSLDTKPKFGFIAPLSTTQAGAVILPAVQVGVVDALGRVDRRANATVTVAIGANPSGGSLSGTHTASTSFGVASFSNLSIDKIGHGYTLIASASGYPSATSAPFDIVANGPSLSTSTLSANPTQLTVNGTTTLTVTVRDQYGNPIAGQTVSLSSSGSTVGFLPRGGSGTTDASGVFTATYRSTSSGTKTVTASFAGLSLNTTVTFLAGAPSVSRSSMVVSPTTVTANGTSTTSLTVTVRDAYGNPVAGQAVNLSATGTGNTLQPASGTTNASGVFTATLSSTKAETKTVTATFSGSSITKMVTFVIGSPASSTSSIIASPSTVAADGTSTTTLTVTVEDVSGNPVAGQAVTLSSSGSANVFAPASGTTSASGVFTSRRHWHRPPSRPRR